jgi:hypothetical protein
MSEVCEHERSVPKPLPTVAAQYGTVAAGKLWLSRDRQGAVC